MSTLIILFLMYIIPCAIISGSIYYVFKDDNLNPESTRGKEAAFIFRSGFLPVFNLILLVFFILAIVWELLGRVVCRVSNQ